MTTINELGEFNVPEVFDPDANRATAYASLLATEVRKIGDVRSLGQDAPTTQIPCGICGAMFTPGKYRKKYCSDKCSDEARRRSWRRQWSERKKKWAK